jgi:hypothetical protein
MNDPSERDTIPRACFRLDTGVEVLDEWARSATQTRKNAIYRALFAMVDGALFRTYRVIDDFQRPNELFVIVRDDLMMKIRINSLESFDIVHIGPVTGRARHRAR